MKRIFDISVPVHARMPLWPGDPEVKIEMFSAISEGEMANISKISLGVHSGTHIDAPYHFLENGEKLDQLQLDQLVGEALVVEIPPDCPMITQQTLEDLNIQSWPQRVLFKTKNSQFWQNDPHNFQTDFCALNLGAARFLVAVGVRLVGIDYLSIAPFHTPLEVHQELLINKVIILESIDLSGVQPGLFTLICLPLKLMDIEAAPVRAILMTDH